MFCFTRYNEAKQLLQMALQIEPTYVKGHYRLGLVYSHLAQNDLALKCFNEALRLDPTNKAAQAQIRSLSDRPDDAFKRNLCIVSDDRIGAKRVQETLKEVQNEMGRVSLDSKFTHKNKDDDTKASSETKTVTPIKLTRFELPNKVPQTQFQFTCVWNEVPDPDTRLIFLQRIGADHFGRLFAKGLEPNLFSELLQMLMTARDVEFVTQMLITLSQTRRFDTLLLFLESKDKSSMFEEMRSKFNYCFSTNIDYFFSFLFFNIHFYQI